MTPLQETMITEYQDRLGDYLTELGVSQDWLAEKLDVSRQMVNNLIKKRNRMTMIQYLAIRYVLYDRELYLSTQYY